MRLAFDERRRGIRAGTTTFDHAVCFRRIDNFVRVDCHRTRVLALGEMREKCAVQGDRLFAAHPLVHIGRTLIEHVEHSCDVDLDDVGA